MTEQKQHTDYHRKIMLRKELLGKVKLSGAFYIPFCGDGDIAVDLYQKMGNKIYAGDLDPERVAAAKARLNGADVRQANCDTWPFRDVRDEFCLADFDAYSYPYASFRSFWKDARVASPCIVFFTDAERMSASRVGKFKRPDGKHVNVKDLADRREVYNKYFTTIIQPWFESSIVGWRIVESQKYLRKSMVYWGAILERTDGTQSVKAVDTDDQRIKKVEDSLYEAALSGNVTAIQLYLSNKAPDKWAVKPAASIELDALRGKRIDPIKLAESFRRKK